MSFKEAERKKEKIYINWICYINFLIYSAWFFFCFFLWIQVAMWCYSLFQYSFVPVFLLCIVIVKYIACLCVIEPASQLKAYCFIWLCFKSVRRTSRRNMELFCFSQLFLLMLLVFFIWIQVTVQSLAFCLKNSAS